MNEAELLQFLQRLTAVCAGKFTLCLNPLMWTTWMKESCVLIFKWWKRNEAKFLWFIEKSWKIEKPLQGGWEEKLGLNALDSSLRITYGAWFAFFIHISMRHCADINSIVWMMNRKVFCILILQLCKRAWSKGIHDWIIFLVLY